MSGNMIPIAGETKKRICYFFDSDIGNYHYGPGHPMKPHRIRMTHALVMNYGLYKKMEIFRAKPATRKEMAQFHTDDYVDFLSKVTPDNMDEFLKEQAKFNLGDDCPVFDGLFEYCSISAGGSMEGAARLSRDKCDIAVNWAGGLHHAKKAEANGFCYVNDIVLGILELLRYHKRVLYVDIDVHHGDGVEEAFYTTDRVMTCSFHKYGEFFPGTGELRDTGHGKGKYYAVNFPLRDGITDEAYKNIFEPVITKIVETYQPSAIVLQCGGDSLSGDRLGSFNVSMRGHANCVRFIKSLGLPLLLLGGGGYTIRNVSRTWAYETGLAAGQELCPDIPMNEYYEYYGPTYRLDVPPSNMEDMNITKYLEKTKIQIFENLRHTIPAPSVGLQAIPKLARDEMEVDEDLDDPNERKHQRLLDGLIQRDDEFSDSEDEGEGGRRNVQSHKRARRQSPKFNGNGLLGLHPGSHNSLSQTQRSTDVNFNRLVPSRHSSLSSSATASMNDIQMTHPNEASSKNHNPVPQSRKSSTLSHRRGSQNNEYKTTPSDSSQLPPDAVAQASAMGDIQMFSQEEQIELQKLASEALTSLEQHPTQPPEEPSQATRMHIDDTVDIPTRSDPRPVAGLEITQAENNVKNGSLSTQKARSGPKTASVNQLILKDDSQPPTSVTQAKLPVQDDRQASSLKIASGGMDNRLAEGNPLGSSEPTSANPLPTTKQIHNQMEIDQDSPSIQSINVRSESSASANPLGNTKQIHNKNESDQNSSSIHPISVRSEKSIIGAGSRTIQTPEALAEKYSQVSLNPVTVGSGLVEPTAVAPRFLPTPSSSLSLNPDQPQVQSVITSKSVPSNKDTIRHSVATQTIPQIAGENENLSSVIQSSIIHSDLLEGVTDEFVSAVAQAIAQGEAGTGRSQVIIPSRPPSSTSATTKSNSIPRDLEIKDPPSHHPIASASSQLPYQDSPGKKNKEESIKVEKKLEDSDRSTTPVHIDDANNNAKSGEARVNHHDRTLSPLPPIDPLITGSSTTTPFPPPTASAPQITCTQLDNPSNKNEHSHET